MLVIFGSWLTIVVRVGIVAIVLRVALLVLGGAALTLILQFDRLRKRSLLFVFLTRLLLSLINRRGTAATAVLRGLARIVLLIFDLLCLAYQLFISLRSLFTSIVFVTRLG